MKLALKIAILILACGIFNFASDSFVQASEKSYPSSVVESQLVDKSAQDWRGIHDFNDNFLSNSTRLSSTTQGNFSARVVRTVSSCKRTGQVRRTCACLYDAGKLIDVNQFLKHTHLTNLYSSDLFSPQSILRNLRRLII